MDGTVAVSNDRTPSSSQAIAQGHPSRRDNQSVSSTYSRTSDRDRERGSRSNGNPQVEPAVTRLLVSIKQLLEALTLWSSLKMTETQVSDVYVRLGNDFNAAVAAFRSFNIDMTELLSVPEDLRVVLEQCLSEEATPSNLEIYLPTVRQIITNLLQGLRSKQSVYRRIVSDRKHRTADSQGSEREVRAPRSSRADSMGSSSRHHRSAASSEVGSVRGSTLEGQQRRVTSSSRKKEPVAQLPPPPPPVDDPYFAGGFVPPKTPAADEERIQARRIELSRSEGLPQRVPTDRQESSRPRSATPSSAFRSGDDPNDATITLSPRQQPPPIPDTPPVPPNVIRYSLTDNPVPSVVVDDATPPQSADNIAGMAQNRQSSSTVDTGSTPPETPQYDATQAPVIESSLAALKKSDALERRASKRFSTYNISKMTGTGRERSGLGRTANRRSMAADSHLTPGELNVLTEEDESPVSGKDAFGARNRMVHTPSPVDEEVPPLPPLPSTSASSQSSLIPPSLISKDKSESTVKRQLSVKRDGSTEKVGSPESNALTVFLQLGREVKKVTIERGLSFSSLRVLFVDKFSYSPGKDNFPEIYIRDPSSGVMYELEDVEEVKDKCLLSLNIDPLDQIKQHIDQQMSSLTQELKDLRSTVGTSKRMSQLPHPPPIVTHAFAENDTPVARPTEKQLQSVARRLSRLVVHKGESSPPPPSNGIVPQMTGSGLQPQWTGASVLSETSGRIVSDLKTQFDEVQNLRRDLGVMRQLYVDFMSQTKESLSSLRSQTHAVRQLSNTKVGGAREYITAGKTNLDTRTQNALTRVEELQDTVENLKEDVLKRFVSPRSNVVKTVEKEIAEVSAELESLKEYIGTVKPMWKKTWEEELQNIVEEQQFLTHQEEFLQDLLEDQKALIEVYGHVEKVITLRGSGAGRSRSFKPPPPDEGHGGLSTVMMEIRSAAVDPQRRMKAIEASKKNREREMADRSDEFEAELKSFVSGKKLKLTGGADEIERVRQKRNDLALKAMFNSSQSNVSSTGGATTPTSSSFPDNAGSESPASPTS
ncbi:AIP3-domain-containing protein [Fomitiporia mediterranea MF3/22]|uniref:AIP3-domain-containing protein n=1 Tax=Fomitiporia mediterranea (strain MF3/22) TaxID=694068 RepID=UPI0004408930|nr:AIP3-domain-containing protein [Fomitiporia mediterranea MF3/22]EJD07419.1 AIP3-domain-containing protein [Fomitiporia mediterranea MF3/22]